MKQTISSVFVATLLFLMSSNLAKAGIVNGGFETGDFTGWTQSGNTISSGVKGEFEGVMPAEGNFQAFFGPRNSPGFLSQGVATSVGELYNLSFSLANLGGTPSTFEVFANGVLLDSLINPNAFGYTSFSYDVIATSPSTTITFGFQHDPHFFLLDDVSFNQGDVTGVPEPTTMGIFGIGAIVSLGTALRRRLKKALPATT